MKIAFFSDVFLPEPSGVAVSMIDLGKNLASRGHEIRYYVPYYSPRDFRFVGLEPKEYEFHKNIKVIRLPSIPFPFGTTGQARLVIPYARSLRDLATWKPDVIHTQLFFGAGIEAIRASKTLKIPLIGTNHTAITEFVRHSPIKSSLIEGMLMRYVVWYYNQCKSITAPSESVIQEMNTYGNRVPGVAVSNPIDVQLFHPPETRAEREKIRAEWKITSPTALFVGRLSPEKRVDVLLRAFAQTIKKNPAAQLLIVGKGVQQAELENLAGELKIKDKVRFLGFLGRKSLAELYRAVDAFVVASTSETQCLTLMESLASGVIPVGVRARALPEYIKEEFGFLVEPEDYSAMSEKLDWIFNADEAQKETLSKNARMFAEKFSAPLIADRWEKLYKKSIKS